MTRTAAIKIWRTDDNGSNGRFTTYKVPWPEGETVLGAIQQIFAYQDPTLAFRFGCRFKRCGLCAMRISDEDQLACQVRLQDGLEIEPLRFLPVIRDLVVDRRHFLETLRSLEVYPDPEAQANLGEWTNSDRATRYYNTMNCVECYACHSMCPHVGEDGHPGAYVLVKLAQMHYHPQNTRDRARQARDLAVDHCLDCRLCYCPYGVKMQQYVMGGFLERAGPERSKSR